MNSKPYTLCFTFTAKERDEETGFNYHGARYYDASLLTGWLSVDPLADKYPGISSYNYCAWNPVKLVDPDGRDTTISINLRNGNINYHTTEEHANGTMVNFFHNEKCVDSYSCAGDVALTENEQRSTLNFRVSSDAAGVYNKLTGRNSIHQESGVEWNYYNQKDGSGDLVTSHLPNIVNITGTGHLYNNRKTNQLYHFHPRLRGHAWWYPSVGDQRYAQALSGVQCFLNFTGQQYRFDNIVQTYGVIENPNVFRDQYLPLGINPF